MQIAVGTYTGNGTAQTISGLKLGGVPDLVITKGGTNIAAMTTSAHAADTTKLMTGVGIIASGHITALGTNSFSVGASDNVNKSAIAYKYIAIKGAATDLYTGTYVGNATDDQAITGKAFAANWIMVISPLGTEGITWITSVHSAGFAQLGWDANNNDNAIQSITADGFTYGNRANSLNTLTTTYTYIGLKNVTGIFKVLGYPGQAGDNYAVNGYGLQPDALIVKRRDATTVAAFRTLDHAADSCSILDVSADQANTIQSFAADGWVAGTSSAVSGAVEEYISMAFKINLAAGGGGGGGGGRGGSGGGGGNTGGGGGGSTPGGGGSGPPTQKRAVVGQDRRTSHAGLISPLVG